MGEPPAFHIPTPSQSQLSLLGAGGRGCLTQPTGRRRALVRPGGDAAVPARCRHRPGVPDTLPSSCVRVTPLDTHRCELGTLGSWGLTSLPSLTRELRAERTEATVGGACVV